MRILLHYCRRLVIILFKILLTFLPKNKKLILFTSWFGEKYADSSKFEFEYLLHHSDYEVYWVASKKELYDELKSRNIPVLYSKSLKGWWMQARAIMLVSSVQQSDFNPYLYRNCIFFDLDHGFALKEVGFAIPGADKRWISYNKLLRKGVQYWMSAPTEWSMDKVRLCYDVSANNIVRCNKPRTDLLFDKNLQSSINQNVEQIKSDRKAIVWMPTHRSCGEQPIKMSELVDFNKLQTICEENNVVFLIKKHFYHKHEREDVTAYPNIIDITNMDVDSTVILSQADALVSDYSASYIEYLALDRPIILYAYDKDEFLAKERGLFIRLEDNTAGEVVENSEAFLNSIKRICDDWYDTSFAEGRKIARSLYFNDDVKSGEYRKSVKDIIDQLIVGAYKSNWKN